MQELAIQAAGRGFQTFATSDLDSQAKIERFAELIVQECAEVSENYAGGTIPLSIALAIKQHFGVK